LNKINQTFIANLKARMEELGLKVPGLAKRTGLSASGLYGVLDGSNWPQPDNLDRIASALGTTVAALFTGPDDKPPTPTAKESFALIRNLLNDRAFFEQICTIASVFPEPSKRKPDPDKP